MARNQVSKKTTVDRFTALHTEVGKYIPHVNQVLGNEEDFVSLLIKAKSDGTCLAVLKQYGIDGGPMVCFGTGYGALGCLLALDGAVQGGNWRPDKPWRPEGK